MDTEYLKKICAEYSTEDLLRHVLIESHQFVPEAIEVFQSEFERRGTDLQSLLNTESLKTGLLEHTVEGCHHHGLKEDVTGTVNLTSKGLFFIPERIFVEGSYPYGAGASVAGALGLVFDEVLLSLSRKNILVDLKGQNLPSSLLTRLLEYSYGVYVEEIRHATYSRNGVVRIQKHDNTQVGLTSDKSHMPTVVSWFKDHNIPFSYKETGVERVIKKLTRRPQ